MLRPFKQILARFTSSQFVACRDQDADSFPPNKSDSVATPKRLSWKRKGLLSGIVLVTVFAGTEFILVALGIHPFREAHDPFLDFEPGIPLFVRQTGDYVTNPVKRTYFNGQSFPYKKQPNSFRIFCLGGSTTYGRPYQDTFSYVSGLRNLLQQLAPDRDWQVVNCGGISYSSYRLAALMEELRQYQPDLIIFYEGHNEFLEERTYRNIRERSRLVSCGVHVVSYLRLTTVLLLKPWLRPVTNSRMKAEVDVILDSTVGPETYHRDPKLRRSVLSHFRMSLERVCALSQRAGAQVILVQPAGNLRDFSPFKSERSSSNRNVLEFERHVRTGREALKSHDFQTALSAFSRAIALDPLYAEVRFLAGQAALKIGDTKGAKEHFVAAKDEDVCPLRALSEISQIVEDVGHTNGAAVIRFPEYVAERCRSRLGHDIPGAESFVDHVHPHPELHLELSVLLVREMVHMDLLRPNHLEAIGQAFDKELARMFGSLTPSIKADALCTLAQELTWGGKVREALPIAREAAELAPKNAWVLCQYGRLLEKTEAVDEALDIYHRAVEVDPNEALSLEGLGNALLRRGRLIEARDWLRKAVFHPADHAAPLSFRIGVRVSLGDCLWRMGEDASAREFYHDAQRIDPQSQLVKNRLRRVSEAQQESNAWNTPKTQSKPSF